MRRAVCVLIIAALTLGAWSATFDGTPAAPQPFASAHFDVQVHERNTDGSTSAMTAQHGMACEGPPATHPVGTTYADHVFMCANHVMTALNGNDYGLIVLTPDQMVDFAQSGSVSFEISTERMSLRDWWDLTVSPFADSQALPLLSSLSQGVDLQGPNKNAVVVTIDNGAATPDVKVVRNSAVTTYAGSAPFNANVTAPNQAATRQTFMLTMSPTHVRFGRLASATASAAIYVDQTVATLPFTQGVVQFGHHSYNPTKDNSGQPATWHWDAMNISPAVPFYIGAVSPRVLTAAGTLTFAAAPAGSFLRFSALCKPRLNGVTGTKMTDTGHPEHASSYLMPIAQGATSVALSFIADGWYTPGFGCIAKDFSVFSLNGGPTSTPTPTPQTPTPSPTPSATPSPSPTPTASPTPSTTPSPTPLTYSCVRSDGTIIWQGEINPRSCP